MKRLHILNGEGTMSSFRHSSLEGDTVVWNEMLIDGPLHLSLEDDLQAFFEERANFLQVEYGGSNEEYERIFLSEFRILSALQGYEEIVLWFEYDLFCQANLWFLLYWLGKKNLTAKITTVSPGSFPSVNPFYGMGQLNPEQLESLFPKRISLASPDIQLAGELWEAYCSPTPEAILPFQKRNSPGLPHLQSAIHAHLGRFPSHENGTNFVQNAIINKLNGESADFPTLFRAIQASLPEYGYGDLQFAKILKSLTPVWVEMKDEHFALTEKGELLARNELNLLSETMPTYWIGGYRFHSGSQPVYWYENRTLIPKTNPGN